MVRRGSTVRVRQRASEKRWKSVLLFVARFAVTPGCSGMEHFLELPAFRAPRKSTKTHRNSAQRVQGVGEFLGSASGRTLKRTVAWTSVLTPDRMTTPVGNRLIP